MTGDLIPDDQQAQAEPERDAAAWKRHVAAVADRILQAYRAGRLAIHAEERE